MDKKMMKRVASWRDELLNKACTPQTSGSAFGMACDGIRRMLDKAIGTKAEGIAKSVLETIGCDGYAAKVSSKQAWALAFAVIEDLYGINK